ncbi:cytochrome C [Hydrogenimonas cancrithermarum]|uniref:Cytochrome C n=1 Tax=Hydrogenimonas cancrithermarum TaxID=2993563 RepID=A0ABN6WWQ9_9BACT|nr:cytochrome C [Hydrogenimonas cancrithermarum]BDY13615.1 hypothetical protein HCR_19270 [Hydrogenimonas cancrithermarum]
MKKLLTMVAAGFVAMSLMATSASADAAKGQKIYSKKVKNLCGFNGAKFAAKHSQDEWEELYEEGKFAEEMGKLCPKGAKIFTSGKFKKYLKDLYDFAYEYANDSGNVPAC